ncbi:MAG: hydroxymethylglutaryl-CoA lyase [Bdellovibrionota bacterium]|nr:hydroxymethylglutaryl-CoA lyase [Deltaproteobacteria bacterium]
MIRVKEMGPRDGLQNEKQIISIEDRIKYIHLLEQAGLDYIEVGAFVRPDLIPQMAGTDAVIDGLDLQEHTEISVLVPNIKGFEQARNTGIKEIAVFTAASETFNQKNINASIAESLQRFIEICKQADDLNIKVRGYVSTCFVCPFEGNISPEQVIPVIEKLLEMGCYEVSIGDTIGKATLAQTRTLFEKTHHIGLNGWLAGHFHDTYGQAIDNIKTAMEWDVKTFDASSGGIGGCPYAPGAPGNVGTEDVVQMLQKENIENKVNLTALVKASSFIEKKIGHRLASKVYQEEK